MSASPQKTHRTSTKTIDSSITDRPKGSIQNIFCLNDTVKKKRNEIIWPEWVDSEINAEKWGNPAVSTKRPISSGKGKSKSSAKSSTFSKGTVQEIEQFEDPYPVVLPSSLQSYDIKWVRPKMVAPNARQTIFCKQNNICLNLLNGDNFHLLHSEFMRTYIAAIHILTYMGYKYPFEVEWQTVQFMSNAKGPWKPWNHVYSLCKAGGHENHAPIPNDQGRYVVRLYWLGTWRKFIVDDRYPIDATGQLLLPISKTENDKEFELWPMLLAKALLKIASLTWTDKEELVDFDIIMCLTGWLPQKINTEDMDLTEIWDIFNKYSDHFAWDKNEAKKKQESQTPATKTPKGSKKGSEKGKSSQKSKSRKSKSERTKSTATSYMTKTSKSIITYKPKYAPYSFFVTATTKDLRETSENDVPDISPCWEHDFLIDQSRDIPVVKRVEDITRVIPPWKLYRWLEWAINNGFWDPDETIDNNKFLKIVTNFRKIIDDNDVNLELSIRARVISLTTTCFNIYLTSLHEQQTAKKKAKKEKVKKEKKSGKTKKEVFTDPGIWCDFENVGKHIKKITIYLKPSSFTTHYAVSDIKLSGTIMNKTKKPNKKDDKKRKVNQGPADDFTVKYLFWENVLQKSRNEPLYLFSDSLDDKYFLFCLAHIGSDFPDKEIKDTSKPDVQVKKKHLKLVCKLGRCLKECTCQSPKVFVKKKVQKVDTRCTAYMIVEDFDWTSRQIGDMNFFINTYGTKCLLVEIPRGRTLKRIWINSDSVNFILRIFSNVDFKAGKMEDILPFMASESEIFLQTYYNICSAFANIVRYFGTPEYPEHLKAFYRSYIPNVTLSKKQLLQIHAGFMEEFTQVLKSTFPENMHNDITRCMRVILLNPKFKIPAFSLHYKRYEERSESSEEECICEEDLDLKAKIEESAAYKIQSFFKMVYVKKLKEINDIYHKKNPAVLAILRNIYMDLFSNRSRDTTCPILLRKFLTNKNINKLAFCFPFYNDLKNIIEMKQFTGEITDFYENSWTPIVRRIFFCRRPTYIRAFLFCSLPEYVVRIFNNDTGEEIERYTNHALVDKYDYNRKGFTILAYGWTNGVALKTIPWKLYLINKKTSSASQIDVHSVNNYSSRITGNYVPNLDKLICKCTIVIQQSCVGTFHLQTSSDTVKIKLQCFTKSGKLLYESYGISSVLIPVVNFIVSDNRYSDPFEYMQTSNPKESTTLLGKQHHHSVRRSTIRHKPSFRFSSIIFKSKRKQYSVDIELDQEMSKEFTIKAYVLDDSWPLTLKEWNFIEKFRNRASIENEILSNNPNQSSVEISPRNTISHISSGITPKKTATKSKTNRSRSALLKYDYDKPYWILTSINDVGKTNMLQIDDHRIEEIKEIKRICFANDPERYINGQTLRNEFLENNYVMNQGRSTHSFELNLSSVHFNSADSFSERASKINFEKKKSVELGAPNKTVCPECNKPLSYEELTFNKPPQHKQLRTFTVNMFNDETDFYRWPMSPHREQTVIEQVDEDIENFKTNYENFMKNMDEYLEQKKAKYNFYDKWMESIKQESQFLMRRNEFKREKYIQELQQLKHQTKGKKEGKKKKKIKK